MKFALIALFAATALAVVQPSAAAGPFDDLIPSKTQAANDALRQALAHCLKVNGQPDPGDEKGWHDHYACGDRLAAKWLAAVARTIEESRHADQEAKRRAAARPTWMRRDTARAIRF